MGIEFLTPIEVKIVEGANYWPVFISLVSVIVAIIAVIISAKAYGNSFKSRLSVITGTGSSMDLIEHGSNKGDYKTKEYFKISISNIGNCPANITILYKAHNKKQDITAYFAEEDSTTFYHKGIFVIQIPSGNTKVLEIDKVFLKTHLDIDINQGTTKTKKMKFWIYSNSKRVEKVDYREPK